MTETTETACPAAPRDRSIPARRAARLVKAGREQRIIGLLNRGVSIPEIAAREGVTEKRMRAVVREILARRMPEPPEQFLALQVGRLNEALLVAYGAMSGGNLQAVDRVVRIVRELDRYHGLFVSPERRPSASQSRLEPSAQTPRALAGPLRACPDKAPQTAEMSENAPAPGSPEASPSRAPTDEVSIEAPPTRPRSAPEALEILQSALERSATAERWNDEENRSERSAETSTAVEEPPFTPEFLRASPPPLVGEDQGGESRRPPSDPPLPPAPIGGGSGCAKVIDSTELRQALTAAPERPDTNETAPANGAAARVLTQVERELASGLYALPSIGPDGARRLYFRATRNGVMAA